MWRLLSNSKSKKNGQPCLSRNCPFSFYRVPREIQLHYSEVEHFAKYTSICRGSWVKVSTGSLFRGPREEKLPLQCLSPVPTNAVPDLTGMEQLIQRKISEVYGRLHFRRKICSLFANLCIFIISRCTSGNAKLQLEKKKNLMLRSSFPDAQQKFPGQIIFFLINTIKCQKIKLPHPV